MSSSSSSIDASRDDTSNYNRAVDITAELEQIYQRLSTETQQKKLTDHIIKTDFFKYLISYHEEVNYLN
jgi:hypothetical protein